MKEDLGQGCGKINLVGWWRGWKRKLKLKHRLMMCRIAVYLLLVIGLLVYVGYHRDKKQERQEIVSQEIVSNVFDPCLGFINRRYEGCETKERQKAAVKIYLRAKTDEINRKVVELDESERKSLYYFYELQCGFSVMRVFGFNRGWCTDSNTYENE